MKICWDNLEKLRYTKNGNFTEHSHTYYLKECPNCGEDFLGVYDSICCCYSCGVSYGKTKKRNLWLDEESNIIRKRCTCCNEIKSLDEFHKTNKIKNNINSFCKECNAKKCKDFKENNEDHIKDKRKERYQKNHEKMKLDSINQKHSLARFDTYAHKIDFCEKARRAPDNKDLLEVKCTHCDKWFKPKNNSLGNRIRFLDGKSSKECRFYCSNKCKKSCSIYGQKLYPKGFKEYSEKREVQGELREICLERDNFTCIKCGSKENLICHHIEGILWEPIESADLDMVITVCENCHKEIHSQEGCGYSDMQCK